MRVWASVGALQNERGKLFFAPFARSSATLCRLFRVHRDRATRISVSRPSEPAAAPFRSSAVHASFPTCAAWHSCAREHTRALRAHVRHFSFFAFTSSPLCRKSLYVSRFGVKAFPKMLHRGEASAPHPPSDCNRPPNDRSTRTCPEGENHEKPPAKCRKVGASAPKSLTVAVKAWVKGFSAKPSPLTVWASVCLRMEGEAVKGKNEKQWRRARAPAREKPFTAPASHRRRLPPSVTARASTRKTPRRHPHSPKTRQTTARSGRCPDICHDSSSGTRQNVRGRHTMSLRVFVKCTFQNEDFSAKRLFAPRK